jgi:hypothetical protein
MKLGLAYNQEDLIQKLSKYRLPTAGLNTTTKNSSSLKHATEIARDLRATAARYLIDRFVDAELLVRLPGGRIERTLPECITNQENNCIENAFNGDVPLKGSTTINTDLAQGVIDQPTPGSEHVLACLLQISETDAHQYFSSLHALLKDRDFYRQMFCCLAQKGPPYLRRLIDLLYVAAIDCPAFADKLDKERPISITALKTLRDCERLAEIFVLLNRYDDYLEVARRHLKIVISGKGSPLLDYLHLGTNAFGADAIEVVWKMFFEAIPEHSTELRQGLGRHYQGWLKVYRISCWFPEE